MGEKLTAADVKVCRDGRVVLQSDGCTIGELTRMGQRWAQRTVGRWGDKTHYTQRSALRALLDRVNADG